MNGGRMTSLGSGLLLVIGGCAATPGPIFAPIEPPLAWPPPPAPARIRYLGQLTSAEDLRPVRSPLVPLGELFVGREPPQPLYGPRDVLVTRGGERVWVADPGGRCVHLFDLEHRKYAQLRRMAETQLLSPVGLCAGPEGSVYVCDSEAVAIHQLDADTGAWMATLKLPEELQRPADMMFNEVTSELYVMDVSGHDLKVLAPDGTLRRIIGQRGREPGEFNFPSSITRDGEMIWVVDTGNNRIQGLTLDGEPLRSFGQAGDATGDLAFPKSLAIDSDGHLYVVDARFENVQIFDRDGRLLLVFGQEGSGPGEFWLPGGIEIDARDRIWICDAYNRRLQVFEYLKGPDAGAPENGTTREQPLPRAPAALPPIPATQPVKEAI